MKILRSIADEKNGRSLFILLYFWESHLKFSRNPSAVYQRESIFNLSSQPFPLTFELSGFLKIYFHRYGGLEGCSMLSFALITPLSPSFSLRALFLSPYSHFLNAAISVQISLSPTNLYSSILSEDTML